MEEEQIIDTDNIDEVLKSIEAHIAEQQKSITLNQDLELLLKNKRFNNIIMDVFIKNGKDFLWENIREHEEADLIQKGSARAGNVERFKIELQARLILERFFNTIKDDAEHALGAIEEAEEYRQKLLNPNEEA